MQQPEGLLKSVSRGIGSLSPACKEAVRLQSEALDHKLPLLQQIGLRLHLLICKWCRRYAKQIKTLHCAAHEHPDRIPESGSQTLSTAARERIKQRLQQEKTR